MDGACAKPNDLWWRTAGQTATMHTSLALASAQFAINAVTRRAAERALRVVIHERPDEPTP